MKFTKEEFSEKLKNKLTNNGKKPMQQSERTFKKLVEKIYARLEKMDDDDTELDDAVADYLEDFQEIEGNLNKDKADFVKEWKKKHPEPKPDDDDDDDEDGNDDDEDEGKRRKGKKKSNDSKLDKLLKEIEDLKKAQSKRDTEDKISNLRKELKSKLKKEGVDDEEWLDSYLKKLSINEDTDLDDEKDDAIKLFNRSKAGNDPSPTPKNGGGLNNNDEFNLGYLKKKKS